MTRQTFDRVRQYAGYVATTTTALALSVRGVLAEETGGIDIGTVTTGTGFATDLGSVITAVLSFVMIIAALLVFLYLIWGGIEWITSGGDKGKTESARNKITGAVVGMIILAASYAILTLILRFIGFENLQEVFTEATTIEEANSASGG
ncbi:MAG: hypothetical protein WAU07_00995 [Microgenomates group bacterium]